MISLKIFDNSVSYPTGAGSGILASKYGGTARAARAQTIQHHNTSASFIRRKQVTPRLSQV
jgi:hypothetical protein